MRTEYRSGMPFDMHKYATKRVPQRHHKRKCSKNRLNGKTLLPIGLLSAALIAAGCHQKSAGPLPSASPEEAGLGSQTSEAAAPPATDNDAKGTLDGINRAL